MPSNLEFVLKLSVKDMVSGALKAHAKALSELNQQTIKAINPVKLLNQQIKLVNQQMSLLTKSVLQLGPVQMLKIQAETAQAENQVGTLKMELAELKDKTINVTVNQVEGHNTGGFVGLARGGNVPGVGNTDTVPAMLTPGEFVIKKTRALQFSKLLNLINYAPLETLKKAFEPIKFNLGGMVSPRISLAIPEMPKLAFAGGGTVPSIAAPTETILLKWQIGQRSGSMETLMSQRQQLRQFVDAINETGKGL